MCLQIWKPGDILALKSIIERLAIGIAPCSHPRLHNTNILHNVDKYMDKPLRQGKCDLKSHSGEQTEAAA